MDFKEAVIKRSLWDWAGSPKREKADLLVTFSSNVCVPPGCQLQQILVDLQVSCTAVPCCTLC